MRLAISKSNYDFPSLPIKQLEGSHGAFYCLAACRLAVDSLVSQIDFVSQI